jgi:UDPglucose 6-dehydrogenase
LTLVEQSDVLFVAVQTPHDPAYEGVTPLPSSRVDFDYSYLRAAIRRLAEEIRQVGERKILAIISTVLPGTTERELVPLLNEHTGLVYTPSFIAMGTVQDDYLHPEFVLMGVRDGWAADAVSAFFATITDAPQVRTTIPNAELIKVAYNTFIGFKIAFANTLMEICSKVPDTDVDDVTRALGLATRRLLSPAYLSGGMGDGGGCHPRDNIALSWLARELGLSYDLFEKIMEAREKQTGWLADQMMRWSRWTGLPMVILGKAFKPGVKITTGSPAVLLEHLLTARGERVDVYDYFVDPTTKQFGPSVFLIGTKHDRWPQFPFAQGSVILDPWRYIPQRNGVLVVPIGRYIELPAEIARTPETWPLEAEA